MTWPEIVHQSAEDLLNRVKQHHRLLTQSLATDETTTFSCPTVNCPHKRQLNDILLQVIETLEESRQAFKSKQLETLRKSLIRILVEDP